MWIDRVENRVNDWLGKLPHQPALIAGGVLLIVVLLVTFGAVAQSQVRKSDERTAGIGALRMQLVRCNDMSTAFESDRCRNRVLAAHVPQDKVPRSKGPGWPDAGTAPLQTGAFQPADETFVPVKLPVTLVRGSGT
ncbi:hypothetical protein ACO2Q9_03395 [Variovorax sp. VNK109]|uniref:hypothetical protein n=1 Tax=Variovorax sp. VNK109 TaxID=3400919 RepID=UPI003C11D02B